jgi:hypothetical protein
MWYEAQPHQNAPHQDYSIERPGMQNAESFREQGMSALPEVFGSSLSYPVSIRRPNGRLVHRQGLAQIARKVGVDAERNAHVAGDQLGWERDQDRRQEAIRVGHDR